MKKSVLLNGITLYAIKLQKFAKSICQGDKIYIEGRIKSRQWQTEDGTTKHTSEIQVTEFTFLSTKKMLKTTSKIAVGIRKTNFARK
jgi:single-strand DNA-binding protein